MQKLLEIPIWFSLSLIFWIGMLMVWPIKKTKVGKITITQLDNLDLFVFGIKEDGLKQAILDRNIYFDG